MSTERISALSGLKNSTNDLLDFKFDKSFDRKKDKKSKF